MYLSQGHELVGRPLECGFLASCWSEQSEQVLHLAVATRWQAAVCLVVKHRSDAATTCK
jgi:hypothetical protein